MTTKESWNISRYSRQILLPQFGKKSQELLAKKKILIIGAGGLGCPAALYLAGAGIGTLGIVDNDMVEISNLHRQIGHKESLSGKPKAESLRETVQNLNSSVQVHIVLQRLTQFNAIEIIAGYDIVLDCTDNVLTRYVVNDACAALSKPLVSGAAIGWDGQITVYSASVDCPCYRCIFPEPPPPKCVGSCDASGVLGPIPGVIGCLQALESIKLAANIEDAEPLIGRLLVFDGLETKFRTFQLRKRSSNCIVCGDSSEDFSIVEYDYASFIGLNESFTIPIEKRLSPLEAKAKLVLTNGLWNNDYFCVDVRPSVQYELCHIEGFHNIPLEELSSKHEEIEQQANNGKSIVVICRRVGVFVMFMIL
ncbi:molybdopterin biosynthesis protein MoeB [Galdieria sulphuraria]|uniref:Probable molybdopterin-synthase adenylyltransferase n=1 Tax=Galdieria sulphuraria TaxID=130081 RepID=M2VWE9_GALSU|nr:molybdopterin biosynthesis protein MoeB [Galdieria sulphuraria]EME27571.1 molybdopterin biosynthesis protein MoeB [Galdieria sulphuraria]|eukprot:XP_005704091.1 molybdopterin biosynthesis protein MoeB [Galdieria sulphuraria]